MFSVGMVDWFHVSESRLENISDLFELCILNSKVIWWRLGIEMVRD